MLKPNDKEREYWKVKENVSNDQLFMGDMSFNFFSHSISFPFILYLLINNNPAEVLDNRIKEEMEEEIVCKLWTQEPENFDEEVKSLGTAWC